MDDAKMSRAIRRAVASDDELAEALRGYVESVVARALKADSPGELHFGLWLASHAARVLLDDREFMSDLPSRAVRNKDRDVRK